MHIHHIVNLSKSFWNNSEHALTQREKVLIFRDKQTHTSSWYVISSSSPDSQSQPWPRISSQVWGMALITCMSPSQAPPLRLTSNWTIIASIINHHNHHYHQSMLAQIIIIWSYRVKYPQEQQSKTFGSHHQSSRNPIKIINHDWSIIVKNPHSHNIYSPTSPKPPKLMTSTGVRNQVTARTRKNIKKID